MQTEGTHGKSIVFAVPNGKLLFIVVKGTEHVGSIEILVILAMRALHPAACPGRVRFHALVTNTRLVRRGLKQRRRFLFGCVQTFGEPGAMIRLDTRNSIGEFLHNVLDERSRRAGTVRFECLRIAETAVYIDESVWTEAALGQPGRTPTRTSRRCDRVARRTASSRKSSACISGQGALPRTAQDRRWDSCAACSVVASPPPPGAGPDGASGVVRSPLGTQTAVVSILP